MAEREQKNSDFELEPMPQRSDQLPEDAPAEQVPEQPREAEDADEGDDA
ncbi:MAG: hypothetical protein ACR2ND_12890 [Solirubrobacteraceae bacterium]